MTFLDEAKQIRNEVAKLRPDKRRRYPEELRRRILNWVDRATDAGQLEHQCSKLIGVKAWRFTQWRRLETRMAQAEADARTTKAEAEAEAELRTAEAEVGTAETEPLALVPIAVSGLAMGSPMSLVAPSGYRVEGLSLEQVAALLRELA
jgi:membrane protein involved in colicin uptake